MGNSERMIAAYELTFSKPSSNSVDQSVVEVE
jgi:hypothetical protein